MSSTQWISTAEATAATPAFMNNRMRILSLRVCAGSGNDCAYCHKVIDHGAVEHEVEAFVPAGLRTLSFHRLCHHLWESL